MKIRTGVLAAVAATAVIIGAGVFAIAPHIGAQEPEATPETERGSRRDAYLERVAANLGVDVATLELAMKDARLEMIDEAVAEGRLTDEQAQKARERVENGEGLHFKPEKHGKHERRAKIKGAFVEEAAAAIGITPDELKVSLRAGSSIADEAGAHGVSLDDVKASILGAARTKFDAAVANGRINQARADERLGNLESRLDEALNKKREPAATP